MNDIPTLGFAGGATDRMAHRRADLQWITERLADPRSRLVRFVEDKAVVTFANGNGCEIAYCGADARPPLEAGEEPIFLGSDAAGCALFACPCQGDALAGADALKLIDLRSIAVQGLLPPGELGLLAQARTLLHWHRRHRFCSNCGTLSVPVDGGYRRRCPACAADHFPRTDPVAIMVATRGDRALLGRQPQFQPGVYSALAGFIEPGESIEAAARRETFEEAGIRLGRVAYHSSQPWPFPANLMIGLIGEAENDDIRIDATELEDARWFSREEMRAMLEGRHPDGLKVPPPMAIAHHLVRSVALG